MKGLRPLGLGVAVVGAFLTVLFSADVADPRAFCPLPVCNPHVACILPACVPWTNPWIWVLAGIAVTLVAVGLATLSRRSAWVRIRGWVVLLLGVAALPFGVIGLMVALPSTVVWAQAFMVMGFGAIGIAGAILGLGPSRMRAMNGPS